MGMMDLNRESRAFIIKAGERDNAIYGNAIIELRGLGVVRQLFHVPPWMPTQLHAWDLRQAWLPSPSSASCDGLQQLAQTVKSVEDKKAICRCLKVGAKSLGIQDRFLSRIPRACNIK
ncbi:hypothetical protein J1N35_031648 [Gossypium stocksii]|uniref:Bifunctional inhibitor/plant lipid transfer protein/seed storage helical domain-containing protein n=1 Tax=Gossypium stocksii TaxID=47602 RepID=A0A9D3V1Y9_9ROSI|nr:hypothetical protein J1N35_031648 [Gossypium stocksii]